MRGRGRHRPGARRRDLGGYDTVIYAAPRVQACEFVGITVPGERRTFVNGPVSARQWLVVAGHELGYVFGADHAHALTCRNGAGEAVSLSASCQEEYYGDPFDLMGKLNSYHPNANQYLVDATPSTVGDFSEAPLLQGRSLTIPEHRITVTVTGVDPSGAAVHVESAGLVGNWAGCDGVTVPDRVAAGKQTPVEVRLANAGETVWSDGAGHRVVTRGAPGDLHLAPGTDVAPGAVGSFTGEFAAPNRPGPLPLAWRGQQGDLPFGEDCSATVDVVEELNPPSTPSGLSSRVRSQTSLELGWTASTDDTAVTGYRVYRSTDGGSFDLLATTSAVSVVDSGLTAGASYSYRVEVFDESRNVSPPTPSLIASIPDITPPSAPTGLTAVGTGPDTVQLRWSPSTDNFGVVGYRVYRRGLDSPLYTLAGSTTGSSFRDPGLRLVLYTYYVVAVDAAGHASGRSNEPMVLTCLVEGVCP